MSLWRAGAVAVVALVAAGCATPAAQTGAAPNGGAADPVKYSQCMRAHGVPKFPDPDANGGLRINSDKLGVDPRSSTYTDAEAACKSLLPTGGPLDPAKAAAAQQQALAYSRCMRAHGVPKFPDPTFSDNGAKLDLPPGINPRSAAFKAAEKACASQQPGAGDPGGGPSTDEEGA